MIDRQGQVTRREPDAFDISYRQVKLPQPGEWFLSAVFTLQQGDTEQAQAQIRQLLDKRGASQPIGLASCGSTFKNPPGDHAARLIEQCGLKGHCVGGACVSEKHANFFINTGNATAADLEALIDLVQQQVWEQTGVRLEKEYHAVGDAMTDLGGSA